MVEEQDVAVPARVVEVEVAAVGQGDRGHGRDRATRPGAHGIISWVPLTRRAISADAGAVAEVVRTAFAMYVARLGGVEPWPMLLDYAEAIGRETDLGGR